MAYEIIPIFLITGLFFIPKKNLNQPGLFFSLLMSIIPFIFEKDLICATLCVSPLFFLSFLLESRWAWKRLTPLFKAD